MSRITEFMLKLQKELIEKKGVAESTSDNYLRTLVLLNDKTPFKNLLFLKKSDVILSKLADYALTTRKTIIASVTSVLWLYKESPSYKKTYDYYSIKLKEYQQENVEARGDTSIKTEKEEKNWIEWEDVKKVRDSLQTQIKDFANQKNLTLAQYDVLLSYLIISLYTYLPPRRNMDYQNMNVVRVWNDKMPTDKNYLDLNEGRFIFNTYKTAKTSGQQIVEVPDSEEAPLKDVIVLYLKHNVHYKASRNKATEFRFLTKSDGSPLSAVNSITRILNKLFGKNVGSSMLRHSYLSNKYGAVVEEMKNDAMLQAHGLDMQKTYIRAPDDVEKKLRQERVVKEKDEALDSLKE